MKRSIRLTVAVITVSLAVPGGEWKPKKEPAYGKRSR